MCLSETWLKPDELNIIEDTLKSSAYLNSFSFSVFATSSMHDISHNYTGRPFGGTAIICKQSSDIFCKEVDTRSDRISAVGIYNTKGVLLQIIICVYLPYYDKAKPEQTELYIETLDALQAIIDVHGKSVPLKILGDFNAQLPRCKKLHPLWYRKQGFNNHSRILYEFLSENHMTVVDHMFNQSVNHTYFCYEQNVFTWIDHIVSTTYDLDTITDCRVVKLDADNLSDHLPLRLSLKLPVRKIFSPYGASERSSSFTRPIWNNPSNNKVYCKTLTDKLNNVPLLLTNNLRLEASSSLQEKVDSHISLINTAIHEATLQAGCIRQKRYRPRSFWSPDLAILRDKKTVLVVLVARCRHTKNRGGL